MSIDVMSHVWKHSKASHGPLLVLLAIADFANDEGEAFPSVGTLQKKARLSERATQNAIKELCELGELTFRPGEGRNGTNLYRVQKLHPAEIAPPQKTTETPAEITPKPSEEPSNDLLGENGKPSIKSKVSERGYAFADWFRSTLPEGARLTSSWRDQWAKCFDDMIRLDERTEAEIAKVCKWAREDSFWKTNFYSPLKLRDKKHNVMYFDTLLSKANEAKKNPTPANQSNRNNGTFNAGTASKFSGCEKLA